MWSRSDVSTPFLTYNTTKDIVYQYGWFNQSGGSPDEVNVTDMCSNFFTWIAPVMDNRTSSLSRDYVMPSNFGGVDVKPTHYCKNGMTIKSKNNSSFNLCLGPPGYGESDVISIPY